jgi:hypothetical protein
VSAKIRTPDQRLRVFVSSTLGELAPERSVVRSAIERLRLTPVMFELGARPHPPRALYRSYLAQSDVFVGIYWQRYGWVAPSEAISGLEDEYRLSGGKPRLIYIKTPAAEREDGLKTLLGAIQSDDTASYKTFGTAEELQELLENDLALLLTERFEALAATSATDKARLELRLSPPPIPLTSLLGRDAEIEAVRRLVGEGVRLITVTGAGGIGKSRLVVEVTRRSPSKLPEVHFVPLASVSDAADVMPRITESLGLRIEGTRAPWDRWSITWGAASCCSYSTTSSRWPRLPHTWSSFSMVVLVSRYWSPAGRSCAFEVNARSL